jgi:hypothetical protein
LQMFDRKKCLDSFYDLLRILPTASKEKVLEIHLKNGKTIYFRVEVVDPAESQFRTRLTLVKNDSSSEPFD